MKTSKTHGRTGTSGAQKFFFLVALAALVAWGFFPVWGHYMGASQIRVDVASLLMEYQLTGEEGLRNGVVKLCEQKQIPVKPEEIYIHEDPSTNRVTVRFSYTENVKILGIVSKAFTVQIEDSTVNLGL